MKYDASQSLSLVRFINILILSTSSCSQANAQGMKECFKRNPESLNNLLLAFLLYSCWAFAANGALEAQNFLRKGTGPIPLSEQNLIDCVKGNSSLCY